MGLFSIFSQSKKAKTNDVTQLGGNEDKAASQGDSSQLGSSAGKAAVQCDGTKMVITKVKLVKESVDNSQGIQSISVLGTGCKSCHALFKVTQEAVSNLGLSVEVKHISDLEKIMAHGLISTPALEVNGKIISSGKVLKVKDVESLLGKV